MNDAFVYSWRNRTDGRLYVGWHKGTETDGYLCSSKILKPELVQNPSNFVRSIVAHGRAIDMVALESVILKAVNARDNPAFYNCTNGDSEWFCKGHSLKSIEKMRVAHKGHVFSLETRARMRAAKLGVPKSLEHRTKMSMAHLGMTPTLGHKLPAWTPERRAKFQTTMQSRYGRPSRNSR